MIVLQARACVVVVSYSMQVLTVLTALAACALAVPVPHHMDEVDHDAIEAAMHAKLDQILARLDVIEGKIECNHDHNEVTSVRLINELF